LVNASTCCGTKKKEWGKEGIWLRSCPSSNDDDGRGTRDGKMGRDDERKAAPRGPEPKARDKRGTRAPKKTANLSLARSPTSHVVVVHVFDAITVVVALVLVVAGDFWGSCALCSSGRIISSLGTSSGLPPRGGTY
jgi:hypothetical protein